MPVTTLERPTGHLERPLRRSGDGAMLGGVCDGIARRLGVRTRPVRVVTVILGLVAGLGIAAYMVLWITVIRRAERESIFTRARSDKREKELLFIVAIAALALLLAAQTVGLRFFGVSLWLLTLCALAGLMVWRGASPAEREHLRDAAGSLPLTSYNEHESWRVLALRTTIGVLLIIYASSLLSHVGVRNGAVAYVLVGVISLVLALFVFFAPWWVRTVRELSSERRARVRAQDRADMAAHVHDSVMQTLSLIQRSAGDPGEVTRLARGQERELRGWLANPETFGQRSPAGATLREALLDVERDVEDQYGVGVDVVVVGDAPVDERLRALLDAGREAAVNAAKWSGDTSVSLYVEVEATTVRMFVRDKGCGFDQRDVPEDRQGIRRSIVERMQRHGGTARVTSAPGRGTEVELELARGNA